MRSSRAWVNIFLNNHTNNPSDYVDLLLVSGQLGPELNTTLYSKTSKVKAFFESSVLKPIYDHYSPLGICTQGAAFGICTLKDLAYS